MTTPEPVGRVQPMPAPNAAANRPRHAHGMDCCWDCFAGKRAHPQHDDDPSCEERAGKDGRCTYAKEAR